MRKFRIKEYKSVEILLFVNKRPFLRPKNPNGEFPSGFFGFCYICERAGRRKNPPAVTPAGCSGKCYSEIAFAGVTLSRIASIPKIKSFASAQGLFSGIFSMAKE